MWDLSKVPFKFWKNETNKYKVDARMVIKDSMEGYFDVELFGNKNYRRMTSSSRFLIV